MDIITKLQMIMAYANTMSCKATLLMYECGLKSLLWWN